MLEHKVSAHLCTIAFAAIAYVGFFSEGALAAEYFAGKTIKVVVGFGVTSAYALYGELAVQHLGRFIPGKPAVIISYMPSASGLIAMNYLFESAPKDGTVIGVATQDIATAQALGLQGVRYDAAKFNYIGRASASIPVHMVWHTAPVQSIEDLRTQEIVTGAAFVNGPQADFPRAQNALMGTKWKIIAGFQNDATLVALERGEIQATIAAATLFNTRLKPWRYEGQVRVIVQYSNFRHPNFLEVPTIVELADTSEAKRIFEFLLSIVTVGRSYMAPPGVPTETVAILREAFQGMIEDPDFRADAEKRGADILPLSGEELKTHIKEVLATPPALVARASEVIDPR